MTGEPVLKLPKRLGRPALVEAVVELRFAPVQDAAGDLLPGLLFNQLKGEFPQTKSLPLGSGPRELLQSHPELKYQARFQLIGKAQSVLIGERVLTVSKTPPYSGWNDFRGLVVRIMTELRATELVGSLERLSFKCLNLLESRGRSSFDLLNGEFWLAEYKITDRGLRTRCEIDSDGFVNIVELVAGATVEVDGVAKDGVMLSIDSIRPIDAAEFWVNVPQHLDAGHEMLKSLFFNIVDEAVIKEYQPEWD